jgi:hypothetical protein
MKIGIMTLWQSNGNFGQLLQHYALQRYLSDMGHEPYLIRYDPKKDIYKTSFYSRLKKYLLNPSSLIQFISSKQMDLKIKFEQYKDKKKFDDFRVKYIQISDKIYYSCDELANSPPGADVYISGSDTVWWFLATTDSFEHIKRLCKAYFLDFGNANIIRMAYAPSVLSIMIKKNIMEKIPILLKNFNYISAREKNTVNILRQCGISNVEVAPDPSILLDVDIYRNLYHENINKEVKANYCLLYKINVSDTLKLSALYKWAKNKNLQVIYVDHGQNDLYKKYHATIYDWLYLMDNAKYVITNSFHGIVFAIIFQKQFAAFRLTGRFKDANVRIESFFELLKINRYIINNDLRVLDNPIDWDNISEKLNKLRLDVKDVFCRILFPPAREQYKS